MADMVVLFRDGERRTLVGLDRSNVGDNLHAILTGATDWITFVGVNRGGTTQRLVVDITEITIRLP